MHRFYTGIHQKIECNIISRFTKTFGSTKKFRYLSRIILYIKFNHCVIHRSFKHSFEIFAKFVKCHKIWIHYVLYDIYLIHTCSMLPYCMQHLIEIAAVYINYFSSSTKNSVSTTFQFCVITFNSYI